MIMIMIIVIVIMYGRGFASFTLLPRVHWQWSFLEYNVYNCMVVRDVY